MLAQESWPAITGIGGALGSESVSNDNLIEQTGIKSTGDWIVEHTGIVHRYWAKEGTLAADLGAEAAAEALAAAGLKGEDLTGIYLTALAPDYLGPYNATEIHRRLGAGQACFADELVTACSGSVVALMYAAEKTTLYPESRILTVGTEILSQIIDRQDRRSAILFGDGAGASIVQAVPGAEAPVFSRATAPDREAIYAPAGGLAEPGGDADDPRRKIHMDGRRVAGHALRLMPDVLMDVAKKDGAIESHSGGIDWDRYGLFVPHQANGIMIEELWRLLDVPEDRRVLTVDRHGNTSSASILLALREARRQERLKGPTRVLMTSIGAGMMAAAGAIDVRID